MAVAVGRHRWRVEIAAVVRSLLLFLTIVVVCAAIGWFFWHVVASYLKPLLDAPHGLPYSSGALALAIAALATILVLAVRRVRLGADQPSAPTPLQALSTGILPLQPEVDGPAPDLGPEYRIAGLINRGGQGSIYLAESAAGGARFAVKLPTLADGGGDQALRAFLHEAEESRKLLNAHIITVFN